MWRNKRVSLVYPTYREKGSICDATVEAALTGYIDEIVIVNNNAEAGTSTEVTRAAAVVAEQGVDVCIREVHEQVQGYGAACLRGLDESTGYYRCLSEPDGTFVADDLLKLLAYSDKCDAVFGSRTVRTFIWSGANMWWFLRWGNWAVAKLLEVLLNTNSLSDVGCTMRLVKVDVRKNEKQLEHHRQFLWAADDPGGPADVGSLRPDTGELPRAGRHEQRHRRFLEGSATRNENDPADFPVQIDGIEGSRPFRGSAGFAFTGTVTGDQAAGAKEPDVWARRVHHPPASLRGCNSFVLLHVWHDGIRAASS